MQRPDELVGAFEHEPGLQDGLLVAGLSLDELEEEQLVERESPAGGLHGAQRGWPMEFPKGILEARQNELAPLLPCEILLFGHLLEQHVEILIEQPPKDPLLDLLTRRICGKHVPLGHLSWGVLLCASQHSEFPRLKLPPVEELDGPCDQQEIPLMELPFQPGLAWPGARDHPRIVLQDGLKDTKALTRGDHTLGAYPPNRRDVRTDL